MENVSGDLGEVGPTGEVDVAGPDVWGAGAGAGAHCTRVVAATTVSAASLVAVVVVTGDQRTEGLTYRRRVRLVALMTSVS